MKKTSLIILLLFITPLFSCSNNDPKKINITYEQALKYISHDDYLNSPYCYYYEYEKEQHYEDDQLIDEKYKETNFISEFQNFEFYRSQNYEEIVRGELVEKVEKVYIELNRFYYYEKIIANNLREDNNYIYRVMNNAGNNIKSWPWYQENVLSYDLIKELVSPSTFNLDNFKDIYDMYKVNLEDYYQDYLDEKVKFYSFDDSLIIEYYNFYDYEEELTINKFGFIEKKITKNQISDGDYIINTSIKNLYNLTDVKKYNVSFKNDIEVIENDKYLIETFHWIIEPLDRPEIIFYEKEVYDKFLSYFDQLNQFEYYSNERGNDDYDDLSYHIDIIESSGETYTGEPLSIKVSDNGRVYTYCICKDSGIVTLYPSNGGTYISQNNKDIVNKIFDYYVELLLMDDQLDF